MLYLQKFMIYYRKKRLKSNGIEVLVKNVPAFPQK